MDAGVARQKASAAAADATEEEQLKAALAESEAEAVLGHTAAEAALEQTAALTQRSVGLLLDEDEVRAVGIANPSTRPHPSHPHPSHPNPCPSPNPLEESKVRVRVSYP